ncbi:DoxX family protein [Pseudarthrobacter sp. S9]|uniref:DoxX family protein n=1 Tax=Pseudarthrobacter sp. S9 TaxID=3418421 RepID=UPI003CFCFE5C
MNIVLWIIAGVLALAFLAAGLMKMAQPQQKLAAAGMAWAGDFNAGSVKAIGAVQVLGALGLVLPAVTGIAPALVPLAATGLAVVMIGAAVTHAKRGERQMIGINIVLAVLALFVAVGRFGAWPLQDL